MNAHQVKLRARFVIDVEVDCLTRPETLVWLLLGGCAALPEGGGATTDSRAQRYRACASG